MGPADPVVQARSAVLQVNVDGRGTSRPHPCRHPGIRIQSRFRHGCGRAGSLDFFEIQGLAPARYRRHGIGLPRARSDSRSRRRHQVHRLGQSRIPPPAAGAARGPAAAALDHPFICAVHEVVVDPTAAPASSCSTRKVKRSRHAARRPARAGRGVRPGADIADALRAHAVIIHRDPPQNIVISPSGRPKRSISASPAFSNDGAPRRRRRHAHELDRAGQVVGTPSISRRSASSGRTTAGGISSPLAPCCSNA